MRNDELDEMRTPEQQTTIEGMIRLVSEARSLRRALEQVDYRGKVIDIYHKAYARERRRELKVREFAQVIDNA